MHHAFLVVVAVLWLPICLYAHWFHCRCRRAIIASHFDEAWDSQDCNAMCDHCCKPKDRKEMVVTSFCQALYRLISNAAAVDTKLTGKLYDIFYLLIVCYRVVLSNFKILICSHLQVSDSWDLVEKKSVWIQTFTFLCNFLISAFSLCAGIRCQQA